MFVLNACENSIETTKLSQNQMEEDPIIPTVRDTLLYFDFLNQSYSVEIKAPKSKYKGTVLLLQGWNFFRDDWCKNTEFCLRASEEGYYVVMPDMKKSIYQYQFYAATKSEYLKYPTRKWLNELVCRSIRNEFGLLDSFQNNYVMGLSTGGRGALLIAEENPEIFKAGASLSGDYDQSPFPEDFLYLSYFGADPTQWDPIENPISFIEKWKVPMYIGHGSKDKVVPISHLYLLKKQTDSLKRDLNFVYNIVEGGGHNYDYWGSEVENVLDFFKKNQ